MKFQDNHLIVERGAVKKLLCSSCKVHFIIYRLRPKLHVFYAMVADCYMTFIKNPLSGREGTTMKILFLKKSAFYYRSIAAKVTRVVAGSAQVLRMDLQEIP